MTQCHFVKVGINALYNVEAHFTNDLNKNKRS